MSEKPTCVRDFVRERLQAEGYDGLCVAGECGCGLDDFAPCGDGPFPDCVPAMKLVVPDFGDLIDPRDGEIIHHEGEPGDSVFILR